MSQLVDIVASLPVDGQIEPQSDKAYLRVTRASNFLELNFIYSKVKGGGGWAIRELTAVADALGLPIQLCVHPIRIYARKHGLVPLNKNQLRAWYKRHGFVTIDQHNDLMERRPRCQ